MVVIAVVLSTFAAEIKICCTATALLKVAKVVVRVLLSIEAVEKEESENHREGQQISLTYGIYSLTNHRRTLTVYYQIHLHYIKDVYQLYIVEIDALIHFYEDSMYNNLDF